MDTISISSREKLSTNIMLCMAIAIKQASFKSIPNRDWKTGLMRITLEFRMNMEDPPRK